MAAVKLTHDDLEIVEARFEEDQALVEEYIALRSEVFTSFGGTYYNDMPDKYDQKPSTVFLLILDKTCAPARVVGGRRMQFHEPDSNTAIYVEENSKMRISDMVPHLRTEDLRYVELGGLCFHPDLRGTGYAEVVYKKTFDYLKSKDVDFTVSQALPTNLLRLQEAAIKNGAQQISLRRNILTIKDKDLEPTSFISFKSEDEVPLLSEDMRLQGRGGPASKLEVREMIKKREEKEEEE
jgi:predicted GNAT family N-acyltransferase